MKRLLLVLASFALLMAFIVRLTAGPAENQAAESMMALGFTLIFAYLAGKLISPLKLPKITGYLLAGFLVGPYMLGLLSKPVVINLQLINNIALGLIALTAGGEFRFNTIRPQLNTISQAIIWKTLVVITGFLLFTYFYQGQIAFLKDAATPIVLGVGLILGSLAVAKSPATTIAVITETDAKGPFTDFVLGVTVLKDIVVVLIFSISLSLAKPLILGESGLKVDYVLFVLNELALSVGLGLIAGFLILLYIKYVDKQRTLFLLGFILLGIEVAKIVHAEIVLIFMVAGFFVQNFSSLGEKLIESIKESSLPIYVVFFAIAGASLNFPVFLENWFLALLVVSLRMGTTFIGTFMGGRLTGASAEINYYGWMGFIGQAGLSLGLSALVTENIPGPIGVSIRTLIIASIAINQVIGPVLFRFALGKSGEIAGQAVRSTPTANQ